MTFFMYSVVLVFGLTIGSFLGALSYRLPRGKKISEGRSFCDTCKKPIAWYDNIPILSYLMLKGRSRCCGKKISSRYPIIESLTAVTFLGVYYFQSICSLNIPNTSPLGSTSCLINQKFGNYSLPYLLVLATILIAIFIVDLEKQIIPDEFSILLFIFSFIGLLFLGPDDSFLRIFTTFMPAIFLYLLYLVTKGKGMGLGDVKFVLFGGMLLNWKYTILWISLSFIIGAVIGILLILLKKAKFGKKIAFGPFLIISFFLTFFLGDKIISLLAPYLL